METRTGGQGRTRPVGGPIRVRRTIASRSHVASSIGGMGKCTGQEPTLNQAWLSRMAEPGREGGRNVFDFYHIVRPADLQEAAKKLASTLPGTPAQKEKEAAFATSSFDGVPGAI